MIRIYRSAQTAAAWAAKLAVLCALLAGAITCADIVIRNVGGEGIIGTVDITQMLIVAAAFLTIPHGFISDSHVAVDMGVDRLPFRLQAVCKAVAALLGALLMLAIGWYGIGQFDTVAMMGDRSQTIGLPMVWYWYPLLAGSFFAALIAAVVAFRYAVVALAGHDAFLSSQSSEPNS
ncbi:MAG TPA: TRAP transporter small permease [Ferrovibrio sp.]|uniref:TRAP transporter small permease n=1 Tax=Ferrovibrio sp. TaxID=1917215 RepID=UPI002ED5B4F7